MDFLVFFFNKKNLKKTFIFIKIFNNFSKLLKNLLKYPIPDKFYYIMLNKIDQFQ